MKKLCSACSCERCRSYRFGIDHAVFLMLFWLHLTGAGAYVVEAWHLWAVAGGSVFVRLCSDAAMKHEERA